MKGVRIMFLILYDYRHMTRYIKWASRGLLLYCHYIVTVDLRVFMVPIILFDNIL